MAIHESTARPTVDGVESTITSDLPRAIAVRLERLRREQMFKAMALVKTTEHAIKGELEDEAEVLREVYKILDAVAWDLNEISGINGPMDEDQEEGARESVRKALDAVDTLFLRSEDNSDDERRYGEALDRLRDAQALVEWTPPGDLAAYDAATSPEAGQ